MRDRETEALYYPQGVLSPQDLGTLLCVAPHPDDEVLGPGGLLALAAAAGQRAHVLVLSSGESAQGEASGSMATVRRDESRRAAELLGLPAPRFLDWPDRGIRYGEPLIAALASAVDEFDPQVLLLPSLSEPHPDHQAVALAGVAAAQRGSSLRALLFYEVGAPMHPNALVDITAVAERKWQATRAFASQEAIQPYEAQARALASLRAFGRGDGCTAAEAYFRVEVDDLRRRGPGAALPSWPLARARGELANSPLQLPLVSVLVRSMDRPYLAEALASVAAQTYPNLEVILVNGTGREHGPVAYPPRRMPLTMVDAGPDARAPAAASGRAHAANLALDAARGPLALFLDDDDLIGPEHVERLVAALDRQPLAVAAYAGVRVEGPDGRFVRNYDLPWSAQRLKGINYLPIHAVAFRLDRAREAGLRFDESLPVLEDWAFWRELASLGDFVHCPGVSAVYRQLHGQSAIGDPEHANYWRRWHLTLLERAASASTTADGAALLAWHAVQLDQTQCRAEALDDELARLRVEHAAGADELRALRSEASALRSGADDLRAELQGARSEALGLNSQVGALSTRLAEAAQAADLARRELELMRSSRSWRLTRPLRAMTALLRRRPGS